MKIDWSEQALSDLQEIRGFIARDAPVFAELFVDRIIEGSEHLAAFPQAGRVVPEFARSDVRELLLGSYRLVYHLQDEVISIVTIFHGARLLGPEHLSGLG